MTTGEAVSLLNNGSGAAGAIQGGGAEWSRGGKGAWRSRVKGWGLI